jgi:hypothetical protein
MVLYAGNPSYSHNPQSGCFVSEGQCCGQGGNQQERSKLMNDDRNWGYFYGVLLGDGHINYTRRSLDASEDPTNRRGPMLMLKVADLDFIEAWRDSIIKITGTQYKISRHNPGSNSFGKRQQYKLRVAARWLVDKAEEETCHRTIIPQRIASGSREIKVAFVQGLMDSEAWINFALSGGRGPTDMTLGFACADPWFEDFYRMVQSLGVLTSKIYKRKPHQKKNGDNGKILHLFRLDIQSYVNAGLGFTIKRKADRLAYCSRILNDFTHHYPRYEDYYEDVNDKV